jgi:hypothetical protein
MVITNNAMEETMKRNTAISMGLNSIIAARMPTKDEAHKMTARKIYSMIILLKPY